MKRSSAWIVAIVLALALAAPAAAQETVTRTVPAEVVYTNANRPGDPGNCSAVVFVKWADVPGTISAKAIYTWKGAETSEVKPPPFSDTYELVATYTVDPGFHWINVGRSWSDGPRPNDCSATREKYKTLIGPVARVELTLPGVDKAACAAAKRDTSTARKAVKKLQKKLKKASGAKAKKKLKAKVRKAKTKRTKAVARQKTACSPPS